MKKSLVVLSFVLVSLALVGASDGIIVSIGGIESPLDGSYVEDEVLIEWVNGGFQDAMLKYNLGACSFLSGTTLDSHIDSDGDYLWDLSDLVDNTYCIKIVDGQTTFYNITVIKDTTAPVIEFLGVPYFGNTTDIIPIEFEISDNGTIDEWELDFGDGSDVEINDSVGVFLRSHNYVDEGVYAVTVTAKDEVGNEIEKSVVVYISDEEVDWSISLSADEMNLFSIPLMPEYSDIEEVLGEEISSRALKIWSYQQGKWKYNTPSGSGWSSSSSRLQEIVPGYGYIIFMEEDSVIYGKGSDVVSKIPSQGIEMVPGWNLIGLRGMESKNVSEALSSINLGSSYRWDKVFALENGVWKEVASNPSMVSYNMTSMEAYWVSVITEDGPIYL